MRKLLVIICIIISVILFVVAYSIKPDKPKITYNEIPFVLTYELNGKQSVISDIITCKFDGYTKATTAGKYRKWKVSLKNAGGKSKSEDFAYIEILNVDDKNSVDDFGNKVLSLYFFGGNGYYYMNDDLGHLARGPQKLNEIHYIYQSPDGKIGYSMIDSEEAYKIYGIRLLSWE